MRLNFESLGRATVSGTSDSPDSDSSRCEKTSMNLNLVFCEMFKLLKMSSVCCKVDATLYALTWMLLILCVQCPPRRRARDTETALNPLGVDLEICESENLQEPEFRQ